MMITDINSISYINVVSDELLSPSAGNGVLSLDDLLLKSLSENAVGSHKDKIDVMNRLQDIRTTTDPAKLFELQQRTSDYNLKMSLFATLARKAVGAVETVVRA
ncbi:type III secretion system inner rod subunit SctI [Serratia marcescens]|uniref:type III secretion system inner rod subunit SctI n=1 Tax=Serratia marcescens TaxID=615 RepID=UPI00148DAF0A|nr:type III secretion system inner rod subunit SctI [Serratia marcescens]QJU42308.1 type III secretion system inner rod subunit SctI [Serratia marcescens]